MARPTSSHAAGFPCAKIISYRENPHTPWAPVSILMTRLPGEELAWPTSIVSGGSIRSIRVPNHRVGPCEPEDEFYHYLLSTASSHSFKTRHEYDPASATARAMPLEHGIVFTHGDFAFHNISVYSGHVSGFIDWECAGWCPEY
ncbi:phosphotransferase family protein [Metarhizium robertsii ARSEF 23]|uniref:Phosphotransferase family protein n=1 Tax=Metarhizium robertsii (strain ARSEF 23 / ATCC MYA-3075) TaxID=655844 RepID=E9FBZ9_METRA|nr:phosphotransferase family protein [Metarhizium robertsii ARSEF 23]EFY94770.1 phosphotransferase family protein [Metarhizium robertsii ARSEF 23]